MSSASIEPINNFETNAGSFRGGVSRPSHGAPRPEMSRRVMDVEDLLAWAFRDELPKDRGQGGRLGPQGYSCPLGRMAAIGTIVDNWHREPGFPSAMGPPHPDALLVEAAVERLSEFAQQSIEDELDLVPDFGELGFDEKVAVRRALGMMPALVARSAKLRDRPFWRVSTVPRPMRHGGNGRPLVVRWERETSATVGGGEVAHDVLVPVEVREKGVYPEGAYSPLSYDPSPQSIVEERAEYLVWWGALAAIAAELQGKLASIAVISPGAPQRPWREEMDVPKPPRLFADPSARTYRHEQRELAAAHRMLGARRSAGARGARSLAPRRAATARVPERACHVG